MSASLFGGLGLWRLIEPDEGRNAEIAREMLASGDWLVPHFNGLPFLDKPVGLFWMIAGAFRMFGVNEGAARLPSALAAVALVMLTFAIGRMLLGTRRGFLAATIVATSPLVLIVGRLAIFDVLFSALAILALWSLLQARLVGPPAVWLPVAGLVMGLATLTKGPVGVAVPLLAWLAGRGALPPPRERAGWRTLLAAVLAFACVVLPWVVIVAGREPAFLRYALLDEIVLRFTSPARFHRGAPLYYYMVVLALGLGVWTALQMAWPRAPRWLAVPRYVALGWTAIAVMPDILHRGGVATVVLLIAGGVIYSLGALCYALKWPNPWPRTFAHHEIFHAAPVVAATCHNVAGYFALLS